MLFVLTPLVIFGALLIAARRRIDRLDDADERADTPDGAAKRDDHGPDPAPS